MNHTTALARIILTIVMACSLISAAAGPAAAKETPPELTRAQQVRELVLKQREKVLAHVAAIMAGEKPASEPRQIEPAGEDAATAEDGEPEDGEAEVAEPEDGEPEGGEDIGGEGEEVDELPDTGVGRAHDAGGGSSALMVLFGILATIGASARRLCT